LKVLNIENTGENESEKGKEVVDEQDYAELKERMLRIAAEFDNYKKRAKKDMEASANLGKMAIIKNMLPIIDEFELAILAVNGSKDKSIAKGIEMLYSNLVDTLKKEGLKEIEVGEAFDPYKHEIIMVKESDKKDNTVIEVVKKGYMFEDMMLRPASVIVSKFKDNESKNND